MWFVDGLGSPQGLNEGDTLVTNHPVAAGGSHLPDITVITPVWDKSKIVFFVASRGHHADVGGISPGSIPPHSKTLIEEGAIITSYKLVKDGLFQVRRPQCIKCIMTVHLGQICLHVPDQPSAQAGKDSIKQLQGVSQLLGFVS